jgi:S1-C subfamily serine protease
MSVEPLTANRARQLGVSASSGILVTAVEPSGKAAAAGLRMDRIRQCLSPVLTYVLQLIELIGLAGSQWEVDRARRAST